MGHQNGITSQECSRQPNRESSHILDPIHAVINHQQTNLTDHSRKIAKLDERSFQPYSGK